MNHALRERDLDVSRRELLLDPVVQAAPDRPGRVKHVIRPAEQLEIERGLAEGPKPNGRRRILQDALDPAGGGEQRLLDQARLGAVGHADRDRGSVRVPAGSCSSRRFP